MVMTNEERAYLLARNTLAEYKNKDKAVKDLIGKGIKKEVAAKLVDDVFENNKTENRKYAIPKMVLSGIIFIILLAVFMTTGVLYFIWLPVCAFGFLWGLFNMFMANGYEISTDLDSFDG